MKARVDRDVCTGCGACVEICPAVFELDDESIAIVKVDVVPLDAQDDCREAADSCPVAAIQIDQD